MRFRLVLFLVILGFGVKPGNAQFIVTGQLAVSNHSERSARARPSASPSPGGYLVELYIANFWKGSGTTDTNGIYTIVPTQGIDPDSRGSSSVICRQPDKGQYAYSRVDFRPEGLGYVANAHLELVSTREARYTSEEAMKTIRVVVTVETILYKTGKISDQELNSSVTEDAVKVLKIIPRATRRAIVNKLVFDPSLPRAVSDEYRKYAN